MVWIKKVNLNIIYVVLFIRTILKIIHVLDVKAQKEKEKFAIY
jgi:hypothetical protein